MKRPKLLLATHICAGVLILASYGQQPGTPLDTPTQASVTASASQTVESGQEFEFHLQFNLPPERYGGGEIHYSFRLKSPSTDAASNQGKQIHRSIPLLDGVSAYEIKIPIDDWMPAGTWELTQIILEGGGSHSQWSIPLDGKVTFEVLPIPPVVLHLHAPGTAMAGERLTWTVTIDRYPKRVRGICRSFLSANLRRIDRGEVGLHAADVPVNQIMLQQNQHTYEMSVPISPDTPAGQWAGRVRVSYGLGCSQPNVPEESEFTFTLAPAPGFTTPTSVRVTVNPSQIQLLRTEAERLKATAQHLQRQLIAENMAANQVLLRNSVREELDDLDKTEAEYKEKGKDPSSEKVVDAFFEDIRASYFEARKALANDSSQVRQIGFRLERVSVGLGGSPPRLNPASDAVLACISRQAKAYDLVASSKLLTFNLDVYSDPKGATISYGQRGKEYQPLDHETDWRIENLPRAVYSIRLQKPG